MALCDDLLIRVALFLDLDDLMVARAASKLFEDMSQGNIRDAWCRAIHKNLVKANKYKDALMRNVCNKIGVPYGLNYLSVYEEAVRASVMFHACILRGGNGYIFLICSNYARWHSHCLRQGNCMVIDQRYYKVPQRPPVYDSDDEDDWRVV